MTDQADWNEEHTRIVCKLFAKQVRCGNFSNKYLKNVGYKNVIKKFHEETGVLYVRGQFKNKQAKLKGDYTCWKTLMKEKGLGWDNTKGNIAMFEAWWLATKKVILAHVNAFSLSTTKFSHMDVFHRKFQDVASSKRRVFKMRTI